MSREKPLPRLNADRFFCLGIQPDCLNVDSYSESGLPQAKRIALSPRVKRSINGSPLWFHIAVVTAPIVFLKHNKPNRCPLNEWQHMVLSETRWPMALFDCPRGHRVDSETRVREARA